MAKVLKYLGLIHNDRLNISCDGGVQLSILKKSVSKLNFWLFYWFLCFWYYSMEPSRKTILGIVIFTIFDFLHWISLTPSVRWSQFFLTILNCTILYRCTCFSTQAEYMVRIYSFSNLKSRQKYFWCEGFKISWFFKILWHFWLKSQLSF